jgi:DNA repair ATPase RecN
MSAVILKEINEKLNKMEEICKVLNKIEARMEIFENNLTKLEKKYNKRIADIENKFSSVEKKLLENKSVNLRLLKGQTK